MRISTEAIDDRGCFDPRYTCDLDNSSPELRWEDPPAGTRSFAVLAEDHDAKLGMQAQWVVYQIPGNLQHLPPGIPPQDTLPNGIRQGINGFNKLGYTGPCPPVGHSAHRYVFRVFALSGTVQVPKRATRDQLLSLIQTYILAEARIEGRYRRNAERRAG